MPSSAWKKKRPASLLPVVFQKSGFSGSQCVSHVSMRFCLFFNDTATTEIYSLSLHDALPISGPPAAAPGEGAPGSARGRPPRPRDRKSTRLNSSHGSISYAVFCLKNKINMPLKDLHVSSLLIVTSCSHMRVTI